MGLVCHSFHVATTLPARNTNAILAGIPDFETHPFSFCISLSPISTEPVRGNHFVSAYPELINTWAGCFTMGPPPKMGWGQVPSKPTPKKVLTQELPQNDSGFPLSQSQKSFRHQAPSHPIPCGGSPILPTERRGRDGVLPLEERGLQQCLHRLHPG